MAYIDEIQVRWTTLADGRVYNAASVNDIDRTEIVRRALDDNDVDTIQPLIYLRPDRRARTASFLSYLDGLYSDDVFEDISRCSSGRSNWASSRLRRTKRRNSKAVLDAAQYRAPFNVGNTVADIVRDLEAEIEARRVDRIGGDARGRRNPRQRKRTQQPNDRDECRREPRSPPYRPNTDSSQ
ncbi:hypothetical protein C9J85_05570 [Haloferax sp. wsp5]|nr:hypothetical protein C9J85_05570 [Haloferax sp. wsp5]